MCQFTNLIMYIFKKRIYLKTNLVIYFTSLKNHAKTDTKILYLKRNLFFRVG